MAGNCESVGRESERDGVDEPSSRVGLLEYDSRSQRNGDEYKRDSRSERVQGSG